MILVSDILESMADHVGGHGVDITCSDVSKNVVLKVYWEASRLLMNRGDFEGADKEVTINVCEGCVTLDRRIETIRQFLLDGTPGKLHNDNFKYLQQGRGNNVNWVSGTVLEDMGDDFALMRDLPQSMYIAAYSDRPEDSTANLKIYGTDTHGREVSRHWNDDKGFTIPLKEEKIFAADDCKSSAIFAHVHALKKTRTKGYVYIFGYLPNMPMQWLVTLAPDEESSQHRRYKVPGASSSNCIEMTAQVSMRWVKQYPGDVALIQNHDAFVLMAQAINARNDSELGLFGALREEALAELKFQRAKKHPHHGNTLNIRDSRKRVRNGSTRYSQIYSGGYGAQEAATSDTTQKAYSVVNQKEPAQQPVTYSTVESTTSGFCETAEVDIPGHRAVYVNGNGKLEIAEPGTHPADGFIRDAVLAGNEIYVYKLGPVTGFSGLQSGETYFLGENGIITLNEPESGYVQALGCPGDSNTLILDIGTAVLT